MNLQEILVGLCSSSNTVIKAFFDFDEPTVDLARVCSKSICSFKPDVIVAMGGASAIYLGKIAWLLSEYPDADLKALAHQRHLCMSCSADTSVTDFPRLTKRKFITIPTTSGSGAEVSPYACVFDTASNENLVIADYELTPYMCIADPNFVMSIEPEKVASFGFDAFLHAIDSFVNMRANEFTDGHCINAILLLLEYLPQSYKLNDKAFVAKERVNEAAIISAIAYSNACLGLAHALAGRVADCLKISHGKAAACCLVNTILFNIAAGPRKEMATTKYAELADALFLTKDNFSTEEKIKALTDKINELIATLELPTSFSKIEGAEAALKAHIDEIANMIVKENDSTKCPGEKCIATNEECFGAFVRPPTVESVKKLLNACISGEKYVE